MAPGYPYEPLSYGECLVPKTYQQQAKLKKGDTIQFSLNTGPLWRYVLKAYNDLAAETGWETVPEARFFVPTFFECTIKDFMATAYGKMPSTGSDTQIVMEYGPWWDLLYNNLPAEV